MTDSELAKRLAEAEATIRTLHDELAENNRGLVALSMELEDRVKQRTSELAKANEDLREAKSNAERANRVKDHFLAVLSHELRTPLTPVVMGLSLLLDRPDVQTSVRETLEMIRSNVDMEARLIDDLLDVTRIARGKVELQRAPIELCTVIQRAVAVCKPDIEARELHFGVDLGPSPPYWVEADVARLQQVFWNLLKNAIKFTPHGGCVGIRCVPNTTDVFVEVNDSGIGIEPDALARVFDAFEQAERSITRQFGGLGLGLAISKALVEMHGGDIDAQSGGLNQGATFRVRLPLIAPVKQPKETMPARSQEPTSLPLRILLVEDHGASARMIRMVLAEAGHSVEMAGDVATALELADRKFFDLLVSDLGLPDGSGHDLIRELRARGKEFPSIALSGFGQEDDIRRSYQAGFTAHLTKPASPESLFRTVAFVTSGKRSQMNSSRSGSDEVQVPVFDAEEALERCFGKREMLQEMMKFFSADSVDLLSQMREMIAKGDLAGAGRAAHRLRGSTVYLGAQPATDAAAKMEKAAQSANLAEASKAMIELEHQVELLKKALASQ